MCVLVVLSVFPPTNKRNGHTTRRMRFVGGARIQPSFANSRRTPCYSRQEATEGKWMHHLLSHIQHQ